MAIGACSGAEPKAGLGPSDAAVAALTVRSASASIDAGQTVMVQAHGTSQSGQPVPVLVEWSSSGGSVAAVSDSQALFSAENTGAYQVYARESTAPFPEDSVTITVVLQTSPTVSLSLLPAAANLDAGRTRQFTVTAVRLDGSTYAPTVTYTATGGTITSGGLYTAGSTAGSFRVIAKQQGGTLADTSTVTLNTQTSGGGPYPDEPAGLVTPSTMTATGPNPFDIRPRLVGAQDGRGTYDLDPYGWLLEEGNLNNATIVSDPERGSVFQAEFPAGMGGGGSPFTAVAGGGDIHGLSSNQQITKLFLGFRVKLSSNWVDANLGTKLLFFWSTDPGDGQFYISLTDQEVPYLRGGVGLEHPGVGHVDILGPSHARGVWYQYEYFIQLNTPGMANGVLKCWVDGVLEIDRTNVEFINTVANIDWLKLDMTYGGGLSPVPANMNVRLDDWYLKVAP